MTLYLYVWLYSFPIIINYFTVPFSNTINTYYTMAYHSLNLQWLYSLHVIFDANKVDLFPWQTSWPFALTNMLWSTARHIINTWYITYNVTSSLSLRNDTKNFLWHPCQDWVILWYITQYNISLNPLPSWPLYIHMFTPGYLILATPWHMVQPSVNNL